MCPSRLRRFMAPAALLVISACESIAGPGGPPTALEQLPRALSVHEREVIRASNRFAFDILRETLRDQPAENVFLSPLSASMALGMTMNGASGITFDGMRDALGLDGLGAEHINASYRELIGLLRNLDGSVDMRVANSVWAARDFPFHQSFFQAARDYFDAEVSTIDFAASDAARTINRWVDRSTGGRIPDIVPDPLPPDAVMYLINAIYFKGDWRHRFDASNTRDAPFHLADGRTASVRMMNRTGPARVAYTPTGERILEMAYGRGAFAMTLVLPRQGVTVDQLIEELDADTWHAWTGALADADVQVGLPRFRLEYETRMNQPLIALGMGAAFGVEPGTDFSRMSPLGRNLFISEVKQKTFVDVNEVGTEAAAVTSVEIRVTSGPPSFIADRPFLVAIRERLSGAILFLGKVGDPRS